MQIRLFSPLKIKSRNYFKTVLRDDHHLTVQISLDKLLLSNIFYSTTKTSHKDYTFSYSCNNKNV